MIRFILRRCDFNTWKRSDRCTYSTYCTYIQVLSTGCSTVIPCIDISMNGSRCKKQKQSKKFFAFAQPTFESSSFDISLSPAQFNTMRTTDEMLGWKLIDLTGHYQQAPEMSAFVHVGASWCRRQQKGTKTPCIICENMQPGLYGSDESILSPNDRLWFD